MQELRAAVRQAQVDHWQAYGTDPTDQDLAAAVDADLHKVREARAAGGLCRPGSIDEPHLDGSTVAQTHGRDDERIGHLKNRMMVARMMVSLTERERRVVQLRFEMHWSQSQTGAEMRVSQVQIFRWMRAITTKLRDVATQ